MTQKYICFVGFVINSAVVCTDYRRTIYSWMLSTFLLSKHKNVTKSDNAFIFVIFFFKTKKLYQLILIQSREKIAIKLCSFCSDK